jgi:hypothetical protein
MKNKKKLSLLARLKAKKSVRGAADLASWIKRKKRGKIKESLHDRVFGREADA